VVLCGKELVDKFAEAAVLKDEIDVKSDFVILFQTVVNQLLFRHQLFSR
jgi:hypothetical protein